MTREEFLRLAAAGYNRIPMACETLADFDTPLSIYLKLADEPNSYLLESVQGGEKWGRYSIIGLPCRTVLRVHDHHVSITHDGVEIESHDVEDPLAFVETFKARYNVPTIAGLPRFNGGLVGYFGYDCVRYVEKRLGKCPNPDPLGVPDMFLTRFAPADYLETVRGIGLPYYTKTAPMRMNKGIQLESQSNPLNINTRPDAVIRLKAGSK